MKDILLSLFGKYAIIPFVCIAYQSFFYTVKDDVALLLSILISFFIMDLIYLTDVWVKYIKTTLRAVKEDIIKEKCEQQNE